MHWLQTVQPSGWGAIPARSKRLHPFPKPLDWLWSPTDSFSVGTDGNVARAWSLPLISMLYDIKNAWRCSSTSPCAFVACTGTASPLPKHFVWSDRVVWERQDMHTQGRWEIHTNVYWKILKGRDRLITARCRREDNIEMASRIPCLLLYWCMPVNVVLIYS
jgi:hypothetical protein